MGGKKFPNEFLSILFRLLLLDNIRFDIVWISLEKNRSKFFEIFCRYSIAKKKQNRFRCGVQWIHGSLLSNRGEILLIINRNL